MILMPYRRALEPFSLIDGRVFCLFVLALASVFSTYSLADECQEHLIRTPLLFQPKLSVEHLRHELGEKDGQIRKEIGSGGEGVLSVTLKRKNGIEDVYVTKRFEYSPEQNVAALRLLAKIESLGKLGPFKVIKIRSVRGFNLVADYIEALSVRDLNAHPEYSQSPIAQKFREDFLVGLRTVKTNMESLGFAAKIIGGDGDKMLPYLWVTHESDIDGPAVFAIGDDTLVDARTGQMVIIDPF